MALDIQAPNLSGLASLAGRTNQLNLFPTGALGLQALQQRNAQENSLRDDDLKRMQLQQQGQLELAQQDIQRQQLDQQAQQSDRAGLFQDKQLAFDQQKMGTLSNQFGVEQNYKERELAQRGALGYGELDAKKQELLQEHQKMEMTKLMKEDAQTIKEKGAFASYGLMSLNDAKTPEQAQQISDAFTKEAVSKKYITQEEADAFSKMPLSARQNVLKSKIIGYGMANEYKDMQPKEAAPVAAGTVSRTLPDGTVEKFAPSTTADRGRLEKEISGADNNIRELTQMIQKVPDNFFGAAAVGQTATYLRELGQDIPGVGPLIRPSDEAKASNKLYNDVQSQTKNLSMNIIRDLSGQSYTDKQLEFMNDIVPQIGPTATRSQFDGKTQNLLRFFTESKAAKQELLNSGYNLDTKENEEKFKDAYLIKLREIKSNLGSSDKSSGLRQHLEQKGFSKDEIDAELKRRGM